MQSHDGHTLEPQVHSDCAISLTTLWNGNLLISISALDWYFMISFKAFNPLLTPFLGPSFLLPFLSPLLVLSIFSLLDHHHFSYSSSFQFSPSPPSLSGHWLSLFSPVPPFSVYFWFYLPYLKTKTSPTCSTLLPMLMLFISNDSPANISGTYKLMHAIKNRITCWVHDIEPSDWLLHEVTLVMRGVIFDLVIFLWGLFHLPFPLMPKYRIPLECFTISFLYQFVLL